MADDGPPAAKLPKPGYYHIPAPAWRRREGTRIYNACDGSSNRAGGSLPRRVRCDVTWLGAGGTRTRDRGHRPDVSGIGGLPDHRGADQPTVVPCCAGNAPWTSRTMGGCSATHGGGGR